MTDDELRKLAEAALEQDKAATRGPWHEESLWSGLRCLRKTAEWYPDEDMPVGMDVPWEHDAAFIAAARTREPELARAVLRLLDERNHHRRRHEALKFQIDNEGCVAAHIGERTYECDATKPCGLCRLRAARDELARYKAAVEAGGESAVPDANEP
jgi:hypothetical protein